jgi:hypothetical protein
MKLASGEFKAGSSIDETISTVKLSSLTSLWQRIGVTAQRREEILHEINHANTLAVEKFHQDAEQQLEEAIKRKEATEAAIFAICKVFSIDSEEYYSSRSSASNSSLVDMQLCIDNAIKKLEDALHDRLTSLFEIQLRLVDYVSEMSLPGNELSTHMKSLLHLPRAEKDLIAVANQLFEAGLSVTSESLQKWKDELSKLNVRRTTTSLKARKVKEEVIQLVTDLGYFDETSLNELALNTDEAATYAVKMAIDIIMKGSTSNPPGSDQLLSALEQIQIGLLTVRFERENTIKHLTALMNCIGEEITSSVSLRKDNIVSFFDSVTTSINQFAAKEKDLGSCVEQTKKELFSMVVPVDGTDAALIQGCTVSIKSILDELTENVSPVSEDWLQLCRADTVSLCVSKKSSIIKVS